MNLTKKALEIATKAHESQFRRDGKTLYITHPIAVSEIVSKWIKEGTKSIKENKDKLETLIYYSLEYSQAFGLKYSELEEILYIISVAHDLEENAKKRGFTIQKLIDELKSIDNNNHSLIFFSLIKKSLELLTHDEKDSYLDYILKIKTDRFATLVKLADISHNISTRTGANTAGDKKRDKIAIDKYKLAEYILLN